MSKYKTTTNLSPPGLAPNSHGVKVSSIKTMSGYLQDRVERDKGEKGGENGGEKQKSEEGKRYEGGGRWDEKEDEERGDGEKVRGRREEGEGMRRRI